MRLVWLLAAGLLVAGCASQDPAPPPANEAADDGEQPVGDDVEGEDNETREPTEGSDGDDTDQNTTDDGEQPTMQIHSPAFADGDPIPEQHSKEEGDNTSPPLNLTDVPGEAASLALIVDDPDAPTEEPFVHWLIWNIPPEADQVAEGYPPSGDGKAFADARQGANDFGNERYDGPAPPQGDGPHRYRFQLFALDRELDVDQGAQRAELENAMEGAVIQNATLTGTYDR